MWIWTRKEERKRILIRQDEGAGRGGAASGGNLSD
jgi:hypothetical protein